MTRQATHGTRRDFLRGAAAVAAAGLLAACSAPPATDDPAVALAATGTATARLAEATVSVYWTRPDSLYPFRPMGETAQGVERQLFGALLRTDDALRPTPDLATSIGRTDDPKLWTFTLRHGLRFSDGAPLTAKDVVFTIERAVNPQAGGAGSDPLGGPAGSPWRGRLAALDGVAEYATGRAAHIRGLETPNDRTIIMRLTTPDVAWHHTLAGGAGLCILPAHALAGIPPDRMTTAPFASVPRPTAGAFVLADARANGQLELRRNEAYAGGAVAWLDRLVLRAFARQEPALVQLERGELDLMPVPATEIARLRTRRDLVVRRVPGAAVVALAVNCDRPFLQDKRVRQAMLYALDRNALVKEVLMGEGAVIQSTIGGPDWLGTPTGLNPYPYNPALCRRLLKEANWDAARVIALTYTPGDRVNDALVAAVQQQCKEAGINLDLFQVDAAAYHRRVVVGGARGGAGDFDLALVSGVVRQEPNLSAAYFETAAAAPAGANYGHYTNPMVDDLFARGRATPDPAARKATYTTLAQMLNDELPWLPLYAPQAIYAHNRRLVGFRPPAAATHLLGNAEEWSVIP